MKSRNYSFLAFGIIAILLLTLSILSPSSGDYPLLIRNYYIRLITTIVILSLGSISIRLSYRSGMQQCWYGGEVKTGSFLTPICTGIALGGSQFIIFELLKIYPFEGSPDELIPLISDSLLLTLTLNFILIVSVVYLIKRLFLKETFPAGIFWIAAAIISIAEPLIITLLLARAGLFYTLIQPLFVIEIYYLIGIISFAFLRYSGFLPMLVFRLFAVLTFGLLSILLS